MSKGWDNATLKKLKALTGKGLSTAEIGKRLGMSKNAVVGKLNRLGWNSKAGGVAGATTKKKEPAKKTASKVTVKKSTTTARRATATRTATRGGKTVAGGAKKATATTTTARGGKSLNKNLAMHQRIVQHALELANLKPNQCRWPIGDPDSEGFHFCGAPVFVGKPYCYEHCKQAYQFTPPKKK